MAAQQMAFVVVNVEWFNNPAVRSILNGGRPSQNAETHLIIAPVLGATDPHGVWLDRIETTERYRDGSPVVMNFLIPWKAIVALGTVHDSTRVAAGFAVEGTTQLQHPSK